MKTLVSLLCFASLALAAAPDSGRVTLATAQAVFENLAQLAAGADVYYLENRQTTVSLDDLVGPSKHMKRLVVVAGEDYRTIVFKKGSPITLRMPTGETVGVDARGSEACTYVFHKVHRGDTAASIAAAANMTVENLKMRNPDLDLTQLRPSSVVRLR